MKKDETHEPVRTYWEWLTGFEEKPKAKSRRELELEGWEFNDALGG